MKKLITLMLLFMGSITGVYAQTFDFSCADSPDRMGPNWELYVGDSLVIDNVAWPWKQDRMYYDAPASEYNVDAIDGLAIGRAGTTPGDSWSINSNGIDGTTWTGTPPDRGPLQGIITWVRDIPYIVANPNIFDHPDYEGFSSYVPTTNNVIVEGVPFETQVAGSSRRYSPDGWAGPSPDKIVIWRGSGGYHLGTHRGNEAYTTVARDLSFEDVIRKALTYKYVRTQMLPPTSFVDGVLIVEGITFNRNGNHYTPPDTQGEGERQWHDPNSMYSDIRMEYFPDRDLFMVSFISGQQRIHGQGRAERLPLILRQSKGSIFFNHGHVNEFLVVGNTNIGWTSRGSGIWETREGLVINGWDVPGVIRFNHVNSLWNISLRTTGTTYKTLHIGKTTGEVRALLPNLAENFISIYNGIE